MSNEHCTCTVEVSPDEVDAGTDITLKIQVTCSRKDGLRGSRVSIRNHEDNELAQAELKKSDGEAYELNDIVLAAPRVMGEHVYRAVVVAADKDGALHEQASTEVRFVVKPHAAQLNVWDVPSAIVAGGRFKFTVGVRCSAGCSLAGHGLGVFDQQGSQVGATKLGGEIWPETDALYVAEVEGEAPLAAGAYQWEVGALSGIASCRMKWARLPCPFGSSVLPIAKSRLRRSTERSKFRSRVRALSCIHTGR